MLPHRPIHPAGLGATLAKGFVKMLDAVPRPRRRTERLRAFFRRPAHATPLPLPAAVAGDQVTLIAMAVDRLGPAAIRACCSGVGVRVAVPDEATATMFRAALAQTQQRRVTDRLIEVVVETKAQK